MNTKVEKLESNIVKLEITVPAENFDKAIQKAYKKNSSKYNVPGFRKGKTPLHIIEKYYGESVFFEDAVEAVYEETYPTAIDTNDIKPVDYPQIDVVQIGKNKEFIYTAKVTVKPEVTLGEYKGIELKKNVYTVSEEDIDVTLNSMREKNARIINKEDGAIENGDTAIIDFEGFIDDVAFEGGKGENYELVIGSGSFIPGFEEQLIGVKLNESKDVTVSFPEEYHAEELKGKPALFKVTVNGIKTKELPELDDEFVKDVSELDTLDELKADIRKKQDETNEDKANKEFEEALLSKISDAATVEIPQVMVEREIDYMIKDLDYRLQYQGLNVEKYIELIGTTMEAMRKDFDEIALSKVKMNLVLEAISKLENITASEQELEEKAEAIAKQYGSKDIDKMKAAILSTEKANLTDDIVNSKVVELLVKESKEIA
jgi:trigger factor